MKKVIVTLAAAIAFTACGNHNTDNNNGGSLDSNVTVPDNTRDNPTVYPDTTVLDTNSSVNSKGEGNSPGQEQGSSTNSKNSGSAKDDTMGSK